MPWDPPGAVDDTALARLPFPTAQRLLAGPVQRGSAVRVHAEWHSNGPDGDAELGSFCMAREDGSLSELIGERLRVSYQGRSVIAYCHRGADVDEELSLTRLLFSKLARLDVTALPVTVEVIE
jgi:hypothetical protein